MTDRRHQANGAWQAWQFRSYIFTLRRRNLSNFLSICPSWGYRTDRPLNSLPYSLACTCVYSASTEDSSMASRSSVRPGTSQPEQPFQIDSTWYSDLQLHEVQDKLEVAGLGSFGTASCLCDPCEEELVDCHERVKAQDNTHHFHSSNNSESRCHCRPSLAISRTYTTSSFTSTTSLFLVAHSASNRPAHQSIPWVDHKAPSPTILPSQRPSTISVGRLGTGLHGVRLDHHVARGVDQKAARKLGVLQYSADTGQVGNLLPACIRLRQPYCTTP